MSDIPEQLELPLEPPEDLPEELIWPGPPVDIFRTHCWTEDKQRLPFEGFYDVYGDPCTEKEAHAVAYGPDAEDYYLTFVIKDYDGNDMPLLSLQSIH